MHPGVAERSVGAEETFAADTADLAGDPARAAAAGRSGSAAGRGQAGTAGRTVSIKVRYSDFTTITRSRTLADRTDVTRTIYDTATDLLDGIGPLRAPLRLVGIRLESLAAAGGAARATGARRAGGRMA